MATELGLLSLTQLHKLSQPQDNKNQNQNQNQNQDQDHCQLNPNITSTSSKSTSSTTTGSWMWNPKGYQEAEEDSWEVRAFAEDTGSVMGTTWPPRSYTCAFCRREFRSAQALGGHMNVHRRDRARLHQVIPPTSHPTAAASNAASAAAAASFLVPGTGGLCLFYQLPNPSGSSPASFTACTASSPSPSTLLSISPYPQGAPVSFPAGDEGSRWSRHDHRPIRHEEQLESAESGDGDEELDLELRLGHGPTPS